MPTQFSENATSSLCKKENNNNKTTCYPTNRSFMNHEHKKYENHSFYKYSNHTYLTTVFQIIWPHFTFLSVFAVHFFINLNKEV